MVVRKNIGVVSMVLWVFLGAHVVFAQSNKELGSFEQLTLTLNIPKNKVYPLEPLVFQISLDNKITKPIMGAPCLRPMCGGYFEIYVAQPSKPMEKIDPLSWDSAGIVTNYGPISPGAHFQDRWTYEIGLDEYFYEPGVYHLKAVIPGEEGEKDLESPPAVLHVMEALGPEKLALEFIEDTFPDSPTKIWVLAGPRNELALLFPNTVYSQHAHYRAGMQAVNQNNWGKAVELMQGPAEDHDFPLADEALNILEIYYSSRLPDKARAYQQIINTRFPHSKYADKE